MQARYGEDAEAMLSATRHQNISTETREPRAAKGSVESHSGEIEHRAVAGTIAL